MLRKVALTSVFIALLGTVPSFAHHGYGGRYNQDVIQELEGELVDVYVVLPCFLFWLQVNTQRERIWIKY